MKDHESRISKAQDEFPLINRNIRSESNHQDELFQNNVLKVQPIDEISPRQKPEPLEDFLEEMKKEVQKCQVLYPTFSPISFTISILRR